MMDFVIKILTIALLLVLIRFFLLKELKGNEKRSIPTPLWLLELRADKEALKSLRAARDERISEIEKDYSRAVRALFSKEGEENDQKS